MSVYITVYVGALPFGHLVAGLLAGQLGAPTAGVLAGGGDRLHVPSYRQVQNNIPFHPGFPQKAPFEKQHKNRLIATHPAIIFKFENHRPYL